MPRNTNQELQNIYDTDLDTAALDRWLSIAEGVVDDIAAKDSSITASRLKDIEALLAAHYASAQDPRIESTSRETASVTYKSETGMNLRETSYGQQAIQLDPTGTLSTLGKPSAGLSIPDAKGLDE